jgi:hypothetical protein
MPARSSADDLIHAQWRDLEAPSASEPSSVLSVARGDADVPIRRRIHSDVILLRNRWPRTGALVEQIAASYEADARREDNDSER